MGPIVWIVLALLIVGILVVVIAYKKNRNVPTDYRTFFIVGLTWIPLGIATKNYAFTAIGVVFMLLGLKNRSKWKESELRWKDLPSGARMWRIVLIGLAMALFIGVLVYYFYIGGKENNW